MISNNISEMGDNFVVSTTLPKGQALIRKYLIYSAVNFMNNPRLQQTSSKEKKLFLLKKGLTQDEIDLAFDLCITRPSSEAALKKELEVLGMSGVLIKSDSMLSRIVNLCCLLLFWGGFAYGVYTFYQDKLRPYLDKSKKRSEDVIRDQIDEVSNQVAELSRNLAIVHEFVSTYCQTQNASLEQLKSELSAIKSLLVNKNQFPSVPTIPKWQIVSGDGADRSNPSDSSEEKSE